MKPVDAILFAYWGKADPNYVGEPKWHPLAYHCLDVAAVSACWWDGSPAMRTRFTLAFKSDNAATLRAWILFFVALHDLGKFDIRFQLKAPETLALAWRRVERGRDHEIDSGEIKAFDHGRAGMVWGWRELSDWCRPAPVAMQEVWHNWLAAVTGHHGDYYEPNWDGIDAIEADDGLAEHDHTARHAWLQALEALFLRPVGLTLQTPPPACSNAARAFLAGFCAVCDWIGSNTDEFEYRQPSETEHQKLVDSLSSYFDGRQHYIGERKLLARFGLVHPAAPYAGLPALLGSRESALSLIHI